MRQTKCKRAVRGRGCVQCRRAEEGRWDRADVSIGEANNLSCKEHRLDKNLLHTNRHFNSIRSLRQPSLRVCVCVCGCVHSCVRVCCTLQWPIIKFVCRSVSANLPILCLPNAPEQTNSAKEHSKREGEWQESECGSASETATPAQAR